MLGNKRVKVTVGGNPSYTLTWDREIHKILFLRVVNPSIQTGQLLLHINGAFLIYNPWAWNTKI
jgi:hypothetical protein